MDRRHFLVGACAALLSTLTFGRIDRLAVALPPGDAPGDAPDDPDGIGHPKRQGVRPIPEITAAVDVLIPADPEVPGDFKGSDYNGDWVVADTLGEAGMLLAKVNLDQNARAVAGKSFMACTEEERLNAIKNWLKDRDTIDPLMRDLLSGITSIAMIGTFENNPVDEQETLFESMGWFDPEDPSGTFRIPLEGYPDSFIFPVHLKRGLRK